MNQKPEKSLSVDEVKSLLSELDTAFEGLTTKKDVGVAIQGNFQNLGLSLTYGSQSGCTSCSGCSGCQGCSGCSNTASVKIAVMEEGLRSTNTRPQQSTTG